MRYPESLILIRHGESTGNVARAEALADGTEVMDIPERDPDIPLSDLGRSQAKRVGHWLATQEQPDLIVSSPYLRALDTARIATGRADIRVDERLRDREMGVLYRLTVRGVNRRFPEEFERKRDHGKFYYRPPSGESWADMALRLRFLLSELPDRRILITTHDAVIMLFRYIIEGLSEAELMDLEQEPVANCSVSRWDRGEPVAFNDIAHLTLQ
ncbi:MAG: histidine phosphatase family protein [Streptosporangiaceae bacterium]